MRIIKISGRKVRIKFSINRRTGEVEMIPLEGYNPEHEGITNLLPTTDGKITPNDPADFPKQPSIPEEGETHGEILTI